jgi:hypothetical protein
MGCAYRETDWSELNTLVEKLMASYGIPVGANPSGKVAAE